MTGFGIEFLGCKISQTDADSVQDALTDAGHTADALGPIQVVNTCCITKEAEKKSRKRVRQLARQSPDTQVFVTGCGANLHPDSYADEAGQVTVLPGGAALAIGSILEAADALSGLGCRDGAKLHGDRHPGGSLRSGATQRTRAFVKIQDGCNFDCSYCIVPTVRGVPRSRNVEAVLADVARRVARGQCEIVLTGVNIGLFRDADQGVGLAALLHLVADVDGVARVRISSIESNHVSRRLAQAMADHPKVCPHLHVPMQSGDAGVLQAMGRHYGPDGYARSINFARDVFGDALNVTTDVIIGFPGESDAAFANTADLCATLGITKVHAFPFSARPGTPAFEMDQSALSVSAETKKLRSVELRQAAELRLARRSQTLVGATVSVVAEAGKGHGAILTSDDESISQAAQPAARASRGYTADYTPARLLTAAQNGRVIAGTVVAASPDGSVLVAQSSC